MAVILYRENEDYLQPREIACRISKSVPITHIDWNRGNQHVETGYQELISLFAPKVFLDSHRALIDNIAFIEIWFPQFLPDSVTFIVRPLDSLLLECSNSSNHELLSFAAQRLAGLLEYQVSIIDDTECSFGGRAGDGREPDAN